MNSKSAFLKPTKIFMIVGIFIPGFTAIALAFFRKLITMFGVECAKSWVVLWGIALVLTLLLPLCFWLYLKKTNHNFEQVKLWLTFFNLFEYMSLQAVIAMFFSDSWTLCYVIDGQNGIQFVPAAWAALPVIYLLSLLFKKTFDGNSNFAVLS